MRITDEYLAGLNGRVAHLFTASQDANSLQQKVLIISQRHNYFFAHIDGNKILNKWELVKTIEDVLKFPDEIRSKFPNWDAARDDLLDLSWLFDPPPNGPGYLGAVIFFTNPQTLQFNNKKDLIIFLELLAEASEYFPQVNHLPFYIVIGPVHPSFEEVVKQANMRTSWIET